MKKSFLISFVISLLLFSIVLGSYWFKFANAKSNLAKLEEEKGIDGVGDIDGDNKIEQKKPDELLFLIAGVATADVDEFQTAEEKGRMTGVMSDTMIICKVNFVEGSIDMLSIPRDSRVKVKGGYEKLNSAHSYGGMKLLMQSIRDYTNLDLDYYVRVDYESVEQIVNAIGGVEVEVPEGGMHFTNYLELNIDLDEGLQKLNGADALGFLRYRSDGKGDLGRMERQQYFLKEMIKQTLTPKNLLKLPQLADVYVNYVDTNLSGSIILDALTFAGSLDPEKITTATLQGSPKRMPASDGTIIDFYILDDNYTKEIIEEMFGDYLQD